MKISFERCLVKGEYIPPFYYGLSYVEWDSLVYVFHIIPTNYFVK